MHHKLDRETKNVFVFDKEEVENNLKDIFKDKVLLDKKVLDEEIRIIETVKWAEPRINLIDWIDYILSRIKSLLPNNQDNTTKEVK